MTSLMAIDPLHPRELDSINVVQTQTFLKWCARLSNTAEMTEKCHF